MNGRGAGSVKVNFKSSVSGAAQTDKKQLADYTAMAMPTDTAKVTNTSLTESEIGSGDFIWSYGNHESSYVADKEAYDDFQRYQQANITIKGNPIQGVSEKQIAYAESVRQSVINRIALGKYRSVDAFRQNMGAEKWKAELQKQGFKSYSEYFAHVVASHKTVGALIKETSARTILDNYA